MEFTKHDAFCIRCGREWSEAVKCGHSEQDSDDGTLHRLGICNGCIAEKIKAGTWYEFRNTN